MSPFFLRLLSYVKKINPRWVIAGAALAFGVAMCHGRDNAIRSTEDYKNQIATTKAQFDSAKKKTAVDSVKRDSTVKAVLALNSTLSDDVKKLQGAVRIVTVVEVDTVPGTPGQPAEIKVDTNLVRMVPENLLLPLYAHIRQDSAAFLDHLKSDSTVLADLHSQIAALNKENGLNEGRVRALEKESKWNLLKGAAAGALLLKGAEIILAVIK